MEPPMMMQQSINEGARGGEDNNNNGGGVLLAACRERVCSAADRVRSSVVGFAGKLAALAREDPRRVAHAFKVGLALTIVSTIYYVSPLFDDFGDSTVWAVITVVVVMEFTVGGTLSKGLNRACATLLAGSLAVGAHLVAERCRGIGEPIVLGICVFVAGSAATFVGFLPRIKARYDYGVRIFILTFSLVAVSSDRTMKPIEYAQHRAGTVGVGVAICLFTSIFVFPAWAGEDLHNLAVNNLDKLADFLEGMKSECFRENATRVDLEGKSFLQAYKSVLNSKGKEDSLCTFAKWEPFHGKFRFRHPWTQYQKLGVLCRQCASSMEALSSYLITLKKTHCLEANPEQCRKVRTACHEMSTHSAKVLRELAKAVRTMTVPSPTSNDMSAAVEAAHALTTELCGDAAPVQAVHVVVMASILSDMVVRIKTIAESVDSLAQLAHFRKQKRVRSDVVIDIEQCC